MTEGAEDTSAVAVGQEPQPGDRTGPPLPAPKHLGSAPLHTVLVWLLQVWLKRRLSIFLRRRSYVSKRNECILTMIMQRTYRPRGRNMNLWRRYWRRTENAPRLHQPERTCSLQRALSSMTEEAAADLWKQGFIAEETTHGTKGKGATEETLADSYRGGRAQLCVVEIRTNSSGRSRSSWRRTMGWRRSCRRMCQRLILTVPLPDYNDGVTVSLQLLDYNEGVMNIYFFLF